MIRFKTFKLVDSDSMNEFLLKHPMSSDLSMFGHGEDICIPYEDGKPATIEQKIIYIQKDINLDQQKLDILTHSQAVLDIQIEGAQKEVDKASDKLAEVNAKENCKGKSKEIKVVEGEVARMRNVVVQYEISKVNNSAEATRLFANIEAYRDYIKILENDRER